MLIRQHGVEDADGFQFALMFENSRVENLVSHAALARGLYTDFGDLPPPMPDSLCLSPRDAHHGAA